MNEKLRYSDVLLTLRTLTISIVVYRRMVGCWQTNNGLLKCQVTVNLQYHPMFKNTNELIFLKKVSVTKHKDNQNKDYQIFIAILIQDIYATYSL